MVDFTRPWSVANTPFTWNPPVEEGDPRMLPWNYRADDYQAVMTDPVPWRYLEDGIVIYEGPSLLDGGPIVVIVTGVAAQESENVKTGVMLQTWVLRMDVSPQEAIDTGMDFSICGECIHRGFESSPRKPRKRKVITAEEAARGVGLPGIPARTEVVYPAAKGRTCYVVAAQAPMSVWKKYQRSKAVGFQGFDPASKGKNRKRAYAKADLGELPLLGYARLVRLGSYGDPAAVPLEIWEALVGDCKGWTGYTHQWKYPEFQDYRRLLMASVDNEQELRQARDLGWRTFRVLMGDEQLVAGLEISCPASYEAGEITTCDSCRACQGLMPGRSRRERPGVPGVGIKVHPRMQLLYWPRRGAVRGHRFGVSTDMDPHPSRAEIPVVDYVPQAKINKFVSMAKSALRSPDPGGYVRGSLEYFEPMYHSYLLAFADMLDRRLPMRRNPWRRW